MYKLSIIFSFFYLITYSQRLSSVLDGYTINNLPTDRQIVGSKWIDNVGATTTGLEDDKLFIAKSLTNLSLDKSNHQYLSAALLANIGLAGYNSTEVDVVFNNLQVYTIKNLYELPLVKGEKIVYGAVKASSFDLLISRNLGASVKAKLSNKQLTINSDVDLNSKKRISLSGNNLFVAYKIIKIDKIDSKRKTKSFKNEFAVKNILGYDITFNVNNLVGKAKQRTIEELGIDEYNAKKGIGIYIQKYSKEAKIKISLISMDNGSLDAGIFNKELEVCYCELIGNNQKLYLINSSNNGSRITYDYIFIDNFFIDYKLLQGVRMQGSNENAGIMSTSDNSKMSVISKTYFISTSE